MSGLAIGVVVVLGLSLPLLAVMQVADRRSLRPQGPADGQRPVAGIDEELPAEYLECEQDDHLDADGAWTAYYPPGSLGPYPEQHGQRGRLGTSAIELRRLHHAVARLLAEKAGRP